jgi:hypothetical protein
MQVPIQIVLKGVPDAAAVRQLVLSAAAAIERYYDRITACHVAITSPDGHHRQGGHYDVHVSMLLPGRKDLTVSRQSTGHPEREHLEVALRHAFAQVRRQLQDAARKLRGDTKARTQPSVRARSKGKES